MPIPLLTLKLLRTAVEVSRVTPAPFCSRRPAAFRERPNAVGQRRDDASLTPVSMEPSETEKTGKKLAINTTMPMLEAVLLCVKKTEIKYENVVQERPKMKKMNQIVPPPPFWKENLMSVLLEMSVMMIERTAQKIP
jgi:hypothetical protein